MNEGASGSPFVSTLICLVSMCAFYGLVPGSIQYFLPGFLFVWWGWGPASGNPSLSFSSIELCSLSGPDAVDWER